MSETEEAFEITDYRLMRTVESSWKITWNRFKIFIRKQNQATTTLSIIRDHLQNHLQNVLLRLLYPDTMRGETLAENMRARGLRTEY